MAFGFFLFNLFLLFLSVCALMETYVGKAVNQGAELVGETVSDFIALGPVLA